MQLSVRGTGSGTHFYAVLFKSMAGVDAVLVAKPAFRDKVQSDGTEIVGLGYGGLAEYLRQELRTWKRSLELSGAKVY